MKGAPKCRFCKMAHFGNCGVTTRVTKPTDNAETVTSRITHCPTCRCAKSTPAERQKAYRERKKAAK